MNKAQLVALGEQDSQRRTHISARTRRGIELIPVEDVRYFQADQKYVTVRHKGGEVIIDEPLRDLEEEFGELFVRIHRNALIAAGHIEGLQRSAAGQPEIRLRDIGETLAVSRRHLAGVRRIMKHF